MFTSAVTFGSIPLAFSPGGGLKSLLNPSDDNGSSDGGRLLLLLFSEGRLLLLFPKAPNFSIEFASMILKCKKCFPLVFTLLIALF